MEDKKIAYSEPANYFPDEVLREFKLGPYSEESNDEGKVKTVKAASQETSGETLRDALEKFKQNNTQSDDENYLEELFKNPL